MQRMNWILPLAVVAVLMLIMFLKNSSHAGTTSAETFRNYIAAGAKVIDVRDPDEYAESHLPGTTNIPLGEIEAKIAGFAPDKNTVLLLHCRSGRRSGSAVETLQRLGYTQVHNLGSYSQAEAILSGGK